MQCVWYFPMGDSLALRCCLFTDICSSALKVRFAFLRSRCNTMQSHHLCKVPSLDVLAHSLTRDWGEIAGWRPPPPTYFREVHIIQCDTAPPKPIYSRVPFIVIQRGILVLYVLVACMQNRPSL